MIEKRAIVVGASSGIGKELALLLAERGYKVAALARRQDELDALAKQNSAISPFQHDVTDKGSIPETFSSICQSLGGLDLFIYAAGVMPTVSPTEFDTEKDRLMIEVNFESAVGWINEVAARMQGTKHGTIVAIGSVAGERGRSGQPVYNASKAALATYMEAVRNRLSKHGVKVVTVKPGPVDTPMTAHLKIKKVSARAAAERILDLSNRTGEHFLSPVHRVIFFIIRNFPSPIFRRLKV